MPRTVANRAALATQASTASRLALAVLVIAGWAVMTLTPTITHAQILTASVGGDGFAGVPGCVGRNPEIESPNSPVNAAQSCALAGVTGTAQVSSTYGVLHARASIVAVNAPAPTTLSPFLMIASSGFVDSLQFRGARPARIMVTASETWTTTLNGVPFSSFGSGGFTDLLFAGVPPGPCAGGSDSTETTDPTPSVSRAHSRTVSIDCPLPATGTVYFGYVIGASAGVADAGFILGNNAPFSASAETDAFDTGRITSLQFFDANGVDITSSVVYTAASGTQYPTAGTAAVVPEPAPLTLAGLGLGIVGAVSRRRRTTRA